jgi:predicted nucleic acid-binding protein
MVDRARIYLDTSALLDGVWSRDSGARMILRLGEAGAVHLLVSAQALAEIDAAIRKVAPESLGYLALVLDRAQVQILPAATPDLIERCLAFTSEAGDARILADALVERIDTFVTTDQEHFLDQESIRGIVLFAVVTPDECMEKIKQRYML